MNLSLNTIFVLFMSAFTLALGDMQDMNLAPHERKYHEALNGGVDDIDTFRGVYDRNARIEVTTGPDTVISGTFDEALAPKWKDITNFASKWEPVTNTDGKHPENGAFAFKWTHYLKTRTGCEGMYSGFTVVRFNKRGQIISDKKYSREIGTILKCMEQAPDL